MRRWAGLQLVLICGAASAAQAQSRAPTIPTLSPIAPLSLSSSAFSTSGAVSPALAPQDSLSAMFEQASPSADAAPVRWRSTQVPLSPKTKLRVSVTDPLTAPGATGAQLARAGAETQNYEVSVVRDWPGAVSFKSGKVGIDVSPHAAVGVTPKGGLAEAGARVELSHQGVEDEVVAGLNAMGVDDGQVFGDKGRWYLFAAASGRAVGLNMLRSGAGWDRAGWTTDESSTLVGDAQVGVGWRKGAMQTSLGVLHREAKAQHAYYGYQSEGDTLVAFSFAVRPRE
ncbi:DUF2219 family protein [Phenylobacterium sp. LjRoot219]|uniref:lipid A-modifier LpxR family protein n=1 Tax=Phenylobacterium sp. LjRoot219 TaxID=3342283 RepID=UPI003ECE897B